MVGGAGTLFWKLELALVYGCAVALGLLWFKCWARFHDSEANLKRLKQVLGGMAAACAALCWANGQLY